MAIKKDILLAILSGFLIGTSYIPFPPWALFFCLIPLWYSWLHETSSKRVFLTGWITQFVFTLIGFHWIPYTIVEFGHLPRVLGILGLIAFATFSSLHIPLSGFIWKKLTNKKPLQQFSSLVVLAFLNYLFERYNPQIFPWNMGYPWMWGHFPAYQWADTIGFEGLSFLTYFLNAWILYIVLNFKNKKLVRQHFTWFILFFSAINYTGIIKEKQNSNFDASVTFLVTQANIGNLEKQFEIYGTQYKEPTVAKFLTLTENKLKEMKDKKIDFLLWPETAIPEFMNSSWNTLPLNQLVINFIKKYQIPLITGAYSKIENSEGNGVFFFNNKGELKGNYVKSLLLAFGEYLPGGKWFPFLYKLFPEIADFDRGNGPTTIDLNGVRLGPEICYEGLHPWFVGGSALKGADIFINVTNDSWFGHTFESLQHLYMTLARAIEFRRPLIRATNTGISSAILANGKVLGVSPQKIEWTGAFDIAYQKNAPQTFYAQTVRYFPILIFIFCVIFLCAKAFLRHVLISLDTEK